MSDLYMLDTDTCAFVRSDTLLARIESVPVAQQVMSLEEEDELGGGRRFAPSPRDPRTE